MPSRSYSAWGERGERARGGAAVRPPVKGRSSRGRWGMRGGRASGQRALDPGPLGDGGGSSLRSKGGQRAVDSGPSGARPAAPPGSPPDLPPTCCCLNTWWLKCCCSFSLARLMQNWGCVGGGRGAQQERHACPILLPCVVHPFNHHPCCPPPLQGRHVEAKAMQPNSAETRQPLIPPPAQGR
jgi:hypothetical protein